MPSISQQTILEEIEKQRVAKTRVSPTSQLSTAIKKIAQQDAGEAVDIITYVKAPWGLNENPYPIQLFMLKLIYGIALDDKEPIIPIHDRFRENIQHAFTEAEFLEFLYRNKRCNLSPEDHEQRLGQKRTQVIFRIGRRGTKTTLSQWIAAYEVYKLLRQYSPQQYFKVRADQPIRLTLIATSETQAQKLLGPARSAIKRSPVLKQYVDKRGDSASKIKLNTQRNLDMGIGPESGLELLASPCSARALRGDSNIMVLLEEYGFFNWELQDSNKSDRQVYTAVAPSTADFTDPITRKPVGMVMIISTPLTRESHMFELEDNIWNGKEPQGLILWLPSYWINQLIPPEKLKSDWERDHLGFSQEYEAEYLDSVESAFSKEMLEAIRVDSASGSPIPTADETTWMGVDLGLKNDGTSIAIVATNQNGYNRLIHRENIRMDLPGYESYIAMDQLGQPLDYLDIAKVAARIDHLWGYYGCMGGIYDQWNAFGLQSHLKSRARDALAHIEFNASNNDRVARNTISMIQQQRVVIYAPEEDWNNEQSLLWELNHLQRLQTSGDPPKIKIQASNIKGRHDDQYSALSRALWSSKIGTELHNVPISSASNPMRDKIAKSLRERAETLRAPRTTDRSVPRNMRRGKPGW